MKIYTLASFKIYLCLLCYLCLGVLKPWAQTFSVVGTGTGSNANTEYPAPFGTYFKSAKHQFLVTADDLYTAGISANNKISSLGFNILNLNSSLPLNEFKIKVFITPHSDPFLFGFVDSNLVAESLPLNYNPQLGWNQFFFDTPFSWDGTSNLAIETCFQNPTYNQNASTEWTNSLTGRIWSIWYSSDALLGTCNSNYYFGVSSSNRPVIRFGWDVDSVCAGLPDAGNIAVSRDSGCAGGNIVLSAQNLSEGNQILYQWQSASLPSGAWFDISGANGQVHSINVVNTSYFRLKTLCAASGLENYSDWLSYTVLPGDLCTCGGYTNTIPALPSGGEISSVTVGNMVNNLNTCITPAPGAGSIPSRYANFTTSVIGPVHSQLYVVPFSVTQSACISSNTVNLIQIYVDWNQDEVFQNSERVAESSGTGNNTTPFSGSFTVPLSALTGTTRMRIVCVNDGIVGTNYTNTAFSRGEAEDYCFTVLPQPNCSGMPEAGVASISSGSGCSFVSVSLGVTGLSNELGITYNWEESDSPSGPWNDILGATGSSLTVNVGSTKYFRYKAICLNSGMSNYSNVVFYQAINDVCLCGVFPSVFANSNSGSEISSVTVGSMSNSLNTCSTPAPGPGSLPGRYANFTTSVLGPVHAQGDTVNFNITQNACSGNNSNNLIQIYVDWNQDAIFQDNERMAQSGLAFHNTGFAGSFIIPQHAVAGSTRMRIITVGSGVQNINYTSTSFANGETEDYCFTVLPAGICAGVPDSGTATISSNIGCPLVNFTLYATNLSGGSGVSYQWQQSPSSSGPWADIPGATVPLFAMNSSSTIFLRLKTSCLQSGLENYSNVVSYVSTTETCYCTSYPEIYPTSSLNNEISSVTVGNMTNSLNTCTTPAPGPGSLAGRYANFITTVNGPVQMQGSSVTFSLEQSTCGTANQSVLFQIYVDWNQDGIFQNQERVAQSGAGYSFSIYSGSFTVPFTALAGSTRMRVILVQNGISDINYTQAGFSVGEVEDYCFTVTTAPACNGTPFPGIAAISAPSGCASATFILNGSDLTPASGVQYQWQQAAFQNGPWTDIPGAQQEYHNMSVTSTTFFRLKSLCLSNGQENYSNVVSYSVTGQACGCLTYSAVYPSSNQGTEISSVTVGSMSNSLYTCSTPASGPGSLAGIYANFTTSVTGPSELQGDTVSFSVTQSICNSSTAVNVIQIYVDWNQDGVFQNSERMAESPSATNTTPFTGSFIVPVTALPGSTRMRIVCAQQVATGGNYTVTSFTRGEVEDYCFTVLPSFSCSGSPNQGIATISNSSGCTSASISLFATGLTIGQGVSYQWQQAPSAAGPWSDVAGAVNPTLSTSVVSTTFFRLRTSCTQSGIQNFTNTVSYLVTAGPCACLNYPAVYPLPSDYTQIVLAEVGSMLNNLNTCSAVAPGPGSIVNSYSNFTTSVNGPIQMQGSIVPFDIQQASCIGSAYPNIIQIYVDWNQDGIFQSSERMAESALGLNTTPYTGHFFVPVNALLGTTRMRIISVEGTPGVNYTETSFSWGEVEDYCFTVVPATPCSGIPSPGTASISLASGCPMLPIKVSTAGFAQQTGLSYQWQEAPSVSGPWTNIPGATSVFYNTGVSTNTFFRMKTICSNSNQESLSNVVSYSISGGLCECGDYPTIYPIFDGAAEIFSVEVGTMFNSQNTCTTPAPGLGSIAGRYANFTTNITGPSQIQGSTVNFSVVQAGCGSSNNVNVVQIYIDWNQNNEFETSERVAESALGLNTTPFAGSFLVPVNAPLGSTRMRIVCVQNATLGVNYTTTSFSFGEVEDYCFTVMASPPCAGIPNAGLATISSSVGCPQQNFVLQASGLTTENGVSYQWQQANSVSGPWTDIAGATDISHNMFVNTERFFRLKTTCANSAAENFTNIVSYSITPELCLCFNYSANYPTSQSDTEISSVTVGSMTNNVNTCMVAAPGPGSLNGRYANFTTSVSGPSEMQGSAVYFSIMQNSCGSLNYDNLISLFVDWNQDGIFQNSERVAESELGLNLNAFTGSFSVPMNAAIGNTRMRVVCVNSGTPGVNYTVSSIFEGEVEDYCFTVLPAVSCSGIPNPAVAQISASEGCPLVNFTLSSSGFSVGTSIIYQWQQATSLSGPWTNIPVANYPSIITNTSSTAYYRLRTQCAVSGLENYSNTVSYTVSTGLCACGGYSSNYPSQSTGTEISAVTVGAMSNSLNTCAVPAPGFGSIAGRYANFTTSLAGPSQAQGFSVNYSVTQNTCGATNSNNIIQIYVDWDQDGIFQTSERVAQSASGLNTTPFTGVFNVPMSAATGTTRMRIVCVGSGIMNVNYTTSTFSIGEVEDYCFTVNPAPLCAGIPSPGNASISAASSCPWTFTLSATGLATEAGISFQWQQSSSASGIWTDIQGATSNNQNISLTNSSVVYYRLRTFCSNSGQENFTNVVSYTPLGNVCECIPYSTVYPSVVTGAEISSVTVGSMNNNLNTCSVAAPGPGSIAARYANFTTTVTGPAEMQGAAVNYSITQSACSGSSANNIIQIYIDWNQDGVFQNTERVAESSLGLNTAPFTGNFIVPFSAEVGISRMRVITVQGGTPGTNYTTTTFSEGEVEDYCFHVLETPPCSGAPNPGTATISSTTGCPLINFTLFASNITLGSDIIYQWQSATNPGGPWTDLPGGNSQVYSTNVFSDSYFRMRTVCTSSMQESFTNEVFYSVVGTPCECLVYSAVYPGSSLFHEISSVSIGSMNNNLNTCSVPAPGPGSIAGRYSNFTTTVTAPSALPGESLTFSVTQNSCGWNNFDNIIQIYVDWNMDGVFQNSERMAQSASGSNNSPFTGSFTIPINAIYGSTRMRVVCVQAGVLGTNYTVTFFSEGEVEDYCITVIPPPPCAGAPNAGLASISDTLGCFGLNQTLSLTGMSIASGITYQWQQATSPFGPWNDLPGATGASEVVNTQVNSWYRVRAICAESGIESYSNIVSYTVVGSACECGNYTMVYSNSLFGAQISSVSVGSMANSLNTCSVPAPGPGSIAGRYANFITTVSGPVEMQGSVVPFSITQQACDGLDQNNLIQIYVDWNQDNVFQNTEQVAQSSFNPNTTPFEGVFQVPFTALPGSTRMRIVCVKYGNPGTNYTMVGFSDGEVEDYCFTVTPAPSCSGTPLAGNAFISSSSGCPSANFDLYASGISVAADVLYQWQFADSPSGPWFDLSGGTNLLHQTQVTTQTFFRLKSFCLSSGEENFSSTVSYLIDDQPCLCKTYSTVYPTNLEDTEIQSVSVGSMFNDINTCYVPSSGQGSYTGRYANFTSMVNGPIQMQGSVVSYSISQLSCSEYNFFNIIQIYVDWNADGVFQNSERVAESNLDGNIFPFSGTFMVPLNAQVGTTRMRIIVIQDGVPGVNYTTTNSNFFWGEVEDYCFTVTPSIPCSGVPDNAVVSISTEGGCPGSEFTLFANSLPQESDISFQWQQSESPTGPWYAILGVFNPSQMLNTNTTAYYRLHSLCQNSNQESFSNLISYQVLDNFVSAPSAKPKVCKDTLLIPITHNTQGVSQVGSPSGLPPGVSATLVSDVLTISGTPELAGIFNYSIPLSGICGEINAFGEITVEECNLGINESDFLNIRIYPNPTNNYVTIEGIKPGTDLTLMDVTGKVVFEEKMLNDIYTFSIYTFSDGLYFVCIQMNGLKIREKLIIKK